jgi:hypothetical protein
LPPQRLHKVEAAYRFYSSDIEPPLKKLAASSDASLMLGCPVWSRVTRALMVMS